jgi:hypothetical protein
MFRTCAGPVVVNQVPVVFGSGRPFFATGCSGRAAFARESDHDRARRTGVVRKPGIAELQFSGGNSFRNPMHDRSRAEGWNRISYGCVGSVATRRWRAAGMQAESSGQARSRGNACRSGEMV